MMAIQMSVEQHTFEAVINLPLSNILDLIETVSTAAMFNAQLSNSQDDKISIALFMLSHANQILEQCGCTINTHINHPTWDGTSEYKTE